MGRISIAGLLGFVAVFAIGLAALVNATEVWAGVVFTLTIGLLLASGLAVILLGWRGGGWLGFASFGWGFLLFGVLSGLLSLSSYTWTLPDAAAEWVFLKSNPAPKPPNSPPVVSSSPSPSYLPVAPALPPEPLPDPTLPPPDSIPPTPETLPMAPSGATPTFSPPAGSIPPAEDTSAGSAYIDASEAHEERLIHAKNIGHWLWLLLIAQVGAIVGTLFARGRRAVEAPPVLADRPDAEERPVSAPNIS